ncbi:MAG: Trk system potassium transporter TrkA [Clostridia bacterium]|nr:Trk system potassium transporter TrkA [Clostridia bacterium]
MKIVVAGCGKVGTSVTASLVREGHDVLVIDNRNDVIEEIINIYDVMAVCGSAADFDTLAEAGADKAEIFVSVTGSDEVNLIACHLAKKMGASHAIARVRNPEYNDKSLAFMKQSLGISAMVNPELFAAQELFNILKIPAAMNVESFSGRNLELVEMVIKEGSPLDGMSLIDLRRKYNAQYLVSAVMRGEETYIPDGSFVLKGGDRIGVTAASYEVQRLLKMLGMVQKQARSVMILGASTTAFYLSQMLAQGGNKVKVIEKDPDRAAEFAAKLPPDVVLIRGDGAQEELLLEEGIKEVDAFVSLTGMDEENILISYFASTQEVPKVIAKVNRDELAVIAEKLGLETVISPRKIVSDIIASYARAVGNSLGSNVETLYHLMNDSIEALEFKVANEFRGAKIPLKDLKLKPDILITGITRGRKAIIPSGEDMILPGDRVIAVVAGQQLSDLEDILA